MMSLPNKPAVPLAELFPAHKNETEALDLLSKMLEFHPRKRISIQKALEHPFLLSLHNPDDEPVADFTFFFEFENEELPREKVQELIWDEVRSYHPFLSENPPSQMPRRRARQMLPESKDADSKSSEVDDEKHQEKSCKK
jgi:serine/threonine protein kinase